MQTRRRGLLEQRPVLSTAPGTVSAELRKRVDLWIEVERVGKRRFCFIQVALEPQRGSQPEVRDPRPRIAARDLISWSIARSVSFNSSWHQPKIKQQPQMVGFRGLSRSDFSAAASPAPGWPKKSRVQASCSCVNSSSACSVIAASNSIRDSVKRF